VSLWLFNPVTFVMSTRGSNDNIIALLVFISLFLLLKRQYVLAGFFYGLSVHFKIYPIIYCFVFYFYIDCDRSMIIQGKPLQAITSQYAFFSRNRLVFTIVSASTFIGFTALFYYIYGDEFLQESLLYHLVRKDHRHNNSVYFYLIYQLYDEPSSTILGLLMFIPQWAVVIASGIIFYYDLFFVMTVQTWAFVMFNKVMTAQYYLWYLTLLPIAVINNEFASSKRHYLVVLSLAWAAGQFIWLYYAERFEFHFGDTIACMQYVNYVFFVVNMVTLCYFIKFQQLQITPELVTAKTTPKENKNGKSD
jgi:GPI mannosyltransferase 1 subunit M